MSQQLWSWFMAVDADRSGQVNAQELQRALAMGGLNFSLALCAQMIRMHDRDFRWAGRRAGGGAAAGRRWGAELEQPAGVCACSPGGSRHCLKAANSARQLPALTAGPH